MKYSFGELKNQVKIMKQEWKNKQNYHSSIMLFTVVLHNFKRRDQLENGQNILSKLKNQLHL